MSESTTRNGTGGVHWEFSPDQQAARDALASGDHPIVNFRGGYGTGKSILGSSHVIETANEIPGGRSLVLGQDVRKAKSTTFHVLFERLPGADTSPNNNGDPENSPIVESYHSTDMRLTLTNGHAIQLGGGRNPAATAGAEYNTIWCDEVAHYSCDLDDLIEMLTTRQRTDEGPNTMVWTTTGNGFNQYWRVIKQRETAGGDPIKTNIADIVADTRDNPYLPNKEVIVQQYEGTAREEQALAGGFAASDNLVYRDFGEATHVVEDEAIDTRGLLRRLLIPSDAAVSRRRKSSVYGYAYSQTGGCVALEIIETTDGQYVVIDEFVDDDGTTHISDVCDWINEHRNGPVYTTPPTSDFDIKRLIKDTGNIVHATGEDTTRATPLVRREFELYPSQNGIGGNEDGTPRLTVSDACPATKRALLSHTSDDSTSKRKRTTHTLMCEALRAAAHRTHIEWDGSDDDDDDDSGALEWAEERYEHYAQIARTIGAVLVGLFCLSVGVWAMIYPSVGEIVALIYFAAVLLLMYRVDRMM